MYSNMERPLYALDCLRRKGTKASMFKFFKQNRRLLALSNQSLYTKGKEYNYELVIGSNLDLEKIADLPAIEPKDLVAREALAAKIAPLLLNKYTVLAGDMLLLRQSELLCFKTKCKRMGSSFGKVVTVGEGLWNLYDKQGNFVVQLKRKCSNFFEVKNGTL